MKITLLGAAFDPPHLGHQKITQVLLQKGLADEVWWLPVRYHEFDKQMTADDDRLQMLYLAKNSLNKQLRDKVKISTFELDLDKVSPTYDTLIALSKLWPHDRFSFAIGADNLSRFHEWDDYQQMLDQFTFYVYPRPGFKLEPLYRGMKVLTDVQEIDISSTLVREKVMAGESIAGLVSQPVAEYIDSKKLYTQLK